MTTTTAYITHDPASMHPFRTAEHELFIFTHGAVAIEDTTIVRSAEAAQGQVKSTSWSSQDKGVTGREGGSSASC